MAELHDIVLRPVITEKTAHAEADQNTYVFEVGINTNKIQIRNAVQRLFGVTVESVKTSIVRGKIRRSGKYSGRRSDWKKAYIRLAEGDLLNFHES